MTAFAPAVTGACAMVAVLYWLRVWLEPRQLPVFLSLLFQIVAGGLVYCGVLLGLFRVRILRYIRFLQTLREARLAGEQPVSDISTAYETP